MKKFLTVIFALFLFVPVSAFASDSDISAGAVMNLVNTERSQAGLNSLTLNPLLEIAAQAKAQDMASKGYFEHTGPDGAYFTYWIKSSGYTYTFAGENLALNMQTRSLSATINSWMNSPSHKENILSQNYTETGVGVAYGLYRGQEAVFVVQMFGASKAPAQQVQPAVTQTTAVSTSPRARQIASVEPVIAPKPAATQLVETRASIAASEKPMEESALSTDYSQVIPLSGSIDTHPEYNLGMRYFDKAFFKLLVVFLLLISASVGMIAYVRAAL